MNDVLRPLLGKIVIVYLDDIVVYTKGSLEQHIKDVEEVLKLIQQATLQIKIKKCVFFQEEIHFLKHKISKHSIATDFKKIQAMQNLLTLRNLRDVQSVLRLFQYYKNFVKNFIKIAGLIYITLKKD